MKQFFLILLGCTMILGSCKKTDNSNGDWIPGGSFTVNGQKYQVTSASRITSTNLITYMFNYFDAQTLANCHMNFYFPGTVPPAAGTYTVTASTAGMTGNQVSYTSSTSDGSMTTIFYYPVGNEAVNVTVNDGKITIRMPSATASSSAGSNVTVSAEVGEK